MEGPANFKVELFVIRVGDWGGYMMLDCDDPAAVHKFCSLLPAFAPRSAGNSDRGRCPGRIGIHCLS